MATNVPNSGKIEIYRLKKLNKSKLDKLKENCGFQIHHNQTAKKIQKVLKTAEENCELHTEKSLSQRPQISHQKPQRPED